MGGMSAFIPSRRDEEVNKVAIEQVSQDKDIEVRGLVCLDHFVSIIFA